MQVQVIPRLGYVEIIAITDIITGPKLIHLVDVLGGELTRNSSRNVLVEVRAQSRDVPLLELFSIMARAIRRRINRTTIAYVMTGRPMLWPTRFYEDVAARCGVKIKFFRDRRVALDWLLARQDSILDETSGVIS